MALIKCDECGRMISDKSQFCPGCGYPTHLNNALTHHEPEQQPEPESEPEPAPEPEPELPATEPEVPATEATAPAPEPVAPPADVESDTDSDAEVDNYPYYLEEEIDEQEIARRNHRNKVALFIGVFAALLIAVGFLYLHQSGVAAQPAEEETIEADAATLVEPADSTAAADSISAPVEPAAPVAAPARPARREVAPEPAPAPDAAPHAAERPADHQPVPAPAPAHDPAPAPAPTPAPASAE